MVSLALLLHFSSLASSPVSSQNIWLETAADSLLLSSYNLILIQKVWKSCWITLLPLFVSPQRLCSFRLPPSSTFHSQTLAYYLLISAVLTRSSALSKKACALLVQNTYNIYIAICAVQCSFAKHLMPRCLAVWHPPIPKLCLLSVCIKETERLSQLSPSMRIRYCHLLSAVISLLSSDSLPGSAMCWNIFHFCVFVCVYSSMYILHGLKPNNVIK